MGFGVGMKIEGLQEFSKQLLDISVDIHDKALRSAVRSAAKHVAKNAKRKLTPGKGVRTQALKDAITVKMLKQRGDTSTALVGVDDAPRVDARGKRINPAKYAHLIELGHVGRDGNHVAAIPFLVPAAKESEGEVRSIIESRINEWIKRKS